MTRVEPVTFTADWILEDVLNHLQKMEDSIIVVESKIPIGIITTKDIFKLISSADTTDRPLREYMNSPVITTKVSSTIQDALAQLKTFHIKRSIADEVRKLAAQTRQFSDEIRATLDDIIQSLQEVDQQVSQAAQTDLSLAERSRENLGSLGQELIQMTSKANGHSSSITLATDEIQRLAQEGVMAMQFEDIVTQMMAKIAVDTKNVGNYLHAFLRLHHDREERDGLTRFKQRIAALKLLLSETENQPQVEHSKPDRHSTEIELF